jgi:hypothetical protein
MTFIQIQEFTELTSTPNNVRALNFKACPENTLQTVELGASKRTPIFKLSLKRSRLVKKGAVKDNLQEHILDYL